MCWCNYAYEFVLAYKLAFPNSLREREIASVQTFCASDFPFWRNYECEFLFIHSHNCVNALAVPFGSYSQYEQLCIWICTGVQTCVPEGKSPERNYTQLFVFMHLCIRIRIHSLSRREIAMRALIHIFTFLQLWIRIIACNCMNMNKFVFTMLCSTGTQLHAIIRIHS